LRAYVGAAQFTPAGVLRLSLDGASSAGQVLDLLEGQLKQLAPQSGVVTEPRARMP
jgi:hypothetical protein